MKSMSKTKLPSECATGVRGRGRHPAPSAGDRRRRGRHRLRRGRGRPAAGRARRRACTACPSAASPPPRRRALRAGGPVGHVVEVGPDERSRRGGIRTDSAPGRAGVARGVSPIALNPRNPNRVPWRSNTAARPACPGPARRRRAGSGWPGAAARSAAARAPRSRRCGCWRARARRTPRGSAGRAPRGRRRTSRLPGAADRRRRACSRSCRP